MTVKFEVRDDDSNVLLRCLFKKGEGNKKCGPLYLRGESRKKAIEHIRAKNVYTFRTTQADEFQHPQDNELCPLVRSSNVLHVAQSVENADEYLDKNPIQALVMKDMSKYSNCIGSIGIDPFFVHYCINLQIQIYKKIFSKYKESLQITIDATGAKFRNMVQCTEKKRATYCCIS